MSRTPTIIPESTSFSIDCPPVPVAWNTSGSNRPASSAARRVTRGVVTPNIVNPIGGRSSPLAGIGLATMPAIALAALPSTCREMRLRPATSVTEYIMAMSEGPTYGATFDDATVDTISFGTPTGSARMAGVTSAVPPDPPAPMMPASSPAWATTYLVSASDIAATASPRSDDRTASAPSGWCAATSSGVTSAVDTCPVVPTSTKIASVPAARMTSVMYSSSACLVSPVPTTNTELMAARSSQPHSSQRGHDVSSGRPAGRRPGRGCPERRARRAAGRTCRRRPGRCGG